MAPLIELTVVALSVQEVRLEFGDFPPFDLTQGLRLHRSLPPENCLGTLRNNALHPHAGSPPSPISTSRKLPRDPAQQRARPRLQREACETRACGAAERTRAIHSTVQAGSGQQRPPAHSGPLRRTAPLKIPISRYCGTLPQFPCFVPAFSNPNSLSPNNPPSTTTLAP